MFASISSLVSHTVTKNEGEDSYNVLPAILGGKSKASNAAVRIFHSGAGFFAVRKGNWLLVQGTAGPGSGNIDITADSLKGTGQLYNLLQDPFQKINLWRDKPSLRDNLVELIENVKNHPGSNQKFIQSF
jgi:hypothetical protein